MNLTDRIAEEGARDFAERIELMRKQAVARATKRLNLTDETVIAEFAERAVQHRIAGNDPEPCLRFAQSKLEAA